MYEISLSCGPLAFNAPEESEYIEWQAEVPRVGLKWPGCFPAFMLNIANTDN